MKRVLTGLLAAMVCLGAFALLEGAAMAAKTASVCPVPVGADLTDCGTIITITDTAQGPTASVTSTGQPPYDSSDDTLVGVINNTTKPISALGLKGGAVLGIGVFGFEGDGITTSPYNVPGNPLDPTGYGGPNAWFSNIPANATSGIVNFITPLAPNGGSSYFSLENALSNPFSCKQIVDNSVTHTPGTGTETQIRGTFTPQQGQTTSQAAALCGFTKFDWIQKITTLPDPTPFYAVNPANPSAPIHLTSASVPFNDPYQNGYTYNPAWNSYPYYYDPISTGQPWSLSTNDNGATLSFFDAPADRCLPGGSGTPCGGKTAPAGSKIAFTTHLVGIQTDGSPFDLGIGWTWTDSFNGTSGGISVTASVGPVDPGSGTGGITVTSDQTTTTYQYNGVTVTGVNGNQICPCTVYLPIVEKQSTSTLQGATRPILPSVAQPTPTVVRRIPETHPIGR